MKKILGKILIYIKWISYKKHFKSIGNGTHIFGKIYCSGKNIIIGKKCTLNNGVHLNGDGGLIIGNYCRISAGVQIHTGGLDLEIDYKNRPHLYKKVIISDGVWLGAGSIILPGIKIGEGSVIAAGAVVTKDILNNELWGGIPAKKIKSLK